MKKDGTLELLQAAGSLISELKEAEELRETFLSMPDGLQYEAELSFLDEKIQSLQVQKVTLISKAERILQPLRQYSFAYIASRLHFLEGLTWEQIADKLGFNAAETVKSRVYRSLKQVSDEGLIDE